MHPLTDAMASKGNTAMLIATVSRTSRTEQVLGRGTHVATIRNHDEDGTESYVAHRYASSRTEAREAALRFGALVKTGA